MLITSGTDLLVGDHAHDTAVVTVSGELDATTARDLHDHVNHIAEPALVLDLTAVTFFDSVSDAIRGHTSRRDHPLEFAPSH